MAQPTIISTRRRRRVGSRHNQCFLHFAQLSSSSSSVSFMNNNNRVGWLLGILFVVGVFAVASTSAFSSFASLASFKDRQQHPQQYHSSATLTPTITTPLPRSGILQVGPARSPQQFFASASTAVTVAVAATTSTALAAASNNNTNRNKDNNTNSTNIKTKTTPAVSGVYVRPSGAIERGSGFFVPGLEGPKVRVVIGMVLLVGTLVAHATTTGGGLGTGMTADPTTTTAAAAWSLSDGIAILYSGVLLFQAAIEYTKETTLQLPAKSRRTTTSKTRTMTMHNTDSSTTHNTDAAAAAATTSSAMVTQRWFPDRAAAERDDDEIRTRTINAILVGDTMTTTTSKTMDSYQTKIEWMAAAYLTMTPTTQLLLLVHTNHTLREAEGEGRVRYRIGPAALVGAGVDREDAGILAQGVTAALQELQHSSGGRIAVPLQHPAVQALLFPGGGGGTEDDPNTDTNTATTATGRREEGSSSSHHHGVRTVILQRITVDSCWLVASDELLAKYTTNDLKWLGQLAQYAQVQEDE